MPNRIFHGYILRLIRIYGNPKENSELDSIKPKGYLEKTEALFKEMDLERGLSDLESLKVRWYVEKGIALGKRPELTEGGLMRSLGGWDGVRERV